MERKLVLTSLALLCWLSQSHLVKGQRDEAFEDFFQSKLLEYPSWIAENNLDPSPDVLDVFKGFFSTSPVSDLQYSLWNLGIAGLSTIKTDIAYVTTARPMVVNTTFTTTGNITIFGGYTVTGTINGETIYEVGAWNATFADCVHGEWGVTYNHYSNGSLKVQSGFMLNTTLGAATHVAFEFWEYGIGAEFKNELIESFVPDFQWFYSHDLWAGGHPSRTYFTRYFSEVFANTTWPPSGNNFFYE